MSAPSQTSLRVRYAETDQMGVVHHANYLVWMEVGRVELCKSLGFNYRDMERDDGIYLVVAEATCRYRAPARFDDEVIVKTWVESANKRIVVFAYEIRSGDRVLATASTRHVFVSRQMERTRLPQKYYSLFGIVPDRTDPAAG
ncbi:MAG: acyl-CoA thioesterase [Bryobacteraceae bacterium]